MKLQQALRLIPIIGLALISLAHAAPPMNVQVEVNFLLGYIDGSGCQFYRNGNWHDGRTAQEHLRDKYNYLVARNLINTTEDFIEGAATKSTISGEAYEVRCSGGAAMTSRQWLRDELERFRSF
jgi:hypothetical protein